MSATREQGSWRDPLLKGLEVYRVGGAVRDALLGWPVYDNDWVVVGATPEMMRARGFKPVGRDFPVFLHPDTAEEYALARTERKAGHGYVGFEVHASPDVTLEEDLQRRDLTINAMAEAPTGDIIDPYGGRQDIEARVLRHVSDAFSEDPLRVLRTARFLARYAERGFRIAEETQALMAQVSESGELEHLAAERVWVESEKALGEPVPKAYFQALKACGALEVWFPELAGDAFDEGVAAMAQVPEHGATQSHWRYARLVSALDDHQRDALAARLKLPKAVAQLATHSALTQRFLAGAQTPDAALKWLARLDGWRRPEQVATQLALVEVLSPSQAATLRFAWQQAAAVSPKALVDAGYQGAEIGKALDQERLVAIQRALSAGG
ncbi:polynucleotide adenylyltransferase [Halomonas llamarensis]|uniref:Polynucleotide adenylyltransferase n=1 Tax=Halomonas llamarensis TaxID=2945104 RepID=A0ABT0SNW9_9GAMM|nr:polynucleotide adenylyltransferase [Halomonas llamarensis]MCL7929485.1 polynucleotide adenylyltransferase [Halomonas llamarensis]